MKKKNKYVIPLLALIPTLGVGHIAYAVVPEFRPPASVAPERYDQNVQPIMPENPQLPVDVEKKKEDSKSTGKPQKNEIKFKLHGVIIEGNKSIPSDELKKVYADKINKNVSLTELKGISISLENYYRSKGYFIARVIIPPQRIKKESATVKFVVLEGRISKVNIIGNPGKNTHILEQYLSRITQDDAITEKSLERSLLLANDIPGIRAQAIIAPSPTIVGAAEVNIKVTPNDPTAFLSFDNRGTAFIGNQQLRAGGSVYSVLGPDLLYADYMTSVPYSTQLQSIGGLYKLFFGGTGTNIALNARQTITKPGLQLQILGLQGQSTKYEASIAQPLFRTRATNFSVNAGGYFTQSQNVFAATNTLFYNDKVRVIYVGATYAHTMIKSNFMFDIRFSKGLNIFGATVATDQFTSRPNGTGNFFKTNANASYTRNFTDTISAVLSATGQTSSVSLLTGEQFGYGGEPYGSAFDPSEIIGDKGAAAKLELRYTKAPQIRDVNYVQFFTAYDRGRTWNINTVFLPAYQDGASLSLGMRFGILKKITTSIELAKPFIRNPAVDNNRNIRVFGRCTATF